MAESRGKHVTSTWRRGDAAKRERNPNRINRYITIGSDKAWVPLSLRSPCPVRLCAPVQAPACAREGPQRRPADALHARWLTAAAALAPGPCAGCASMGDSGVEARHRAKVYCLNEDGQWDDRGTRDDLVVVSRVKPDKLAELLGRRRAPKRDWYRAWWGTRGRTAGGGAVTRSSASQSRGAWC